MAGRMKGKTALSSGAASGRGDAQEKLFVQAGVRVNTIFQEQVRIPILGSITLEQDAAIAAAIPMGITGAELWIGGGWYAGH